MARESQRQGGKRHWQEWPQRREPQGVIGDHSTVLPTGMLEGVTVKGFHGPSLECRLLGKEEEKPQFTDEDIS